MTTFGELENEDWKLEIVYLRTVFQQFPVRACASSVPDIKKGQSDDDRQRHDRNKEHDLEKPLFIFEVHEEPEHQARLGRCDQQVDKHAERSQVKLCRLDRQCREREKAEPNGDEGLRADDMRLFMLLHGISLGSRRLQPARVLVLSDQKHGYK
jgi:hypothetical protein